MEFRLTTLLFLICFLLLPWYAGAINKYVVTINQPEPIGIPIISQVTVTSENKNQIIWERQQNDQIKNYNIYRNSSNQENSWDLAGKVDYPGDTLFIDLTSYANIQSYKYRISVIDKCENEISTNLIHKTIYLYLKEIIDGQNTIEWNPYEGINVTAYLIYKGLALDNMSVIDSISAFSTNYTDHGNSLTNCYYKVEAVGFDEDSNPVRKNKSVISKVTSNFVRSLSNVVTNKYDSILNPFENKNLQIYPNPMKSESVIQFPYDPSQHYQLNILDVLGNIVYQQAALSGEFLLKHANLKDGLYILQIVGKKIIQKKLIIGGNN